MRIKLDINLSYTMQFDKLLICVVSMQQLIKRDHNVILGVIVA